jgi:hypothetical protein
MKIKSKIIQRVGIGKAIWLIFWWIAFFIVPHILSDISIFMRFWIWLWYITLWAIIGIFWVMDNYPYLKLHINFWFRWALLWWWMNFILVLFAYNNLIIMMHWTILEWYSPFCLIIEWMIFWLLTDYVATKFAWEGKDLLKEKK